MGLPERGGALAPQWGGSHCRHTAGTPQHYGSVFMCGGQLLSGLWLLLLVAPPYQVSKEPGMMHSPECWSVLDAEVWVGWEERGAVPC